MILLKQRFLLLYQSVNHPYLAIVVHELILQYDHLVPEGFQHLSDCRYAVLDRLLQLPDLILQFAQQGVIRLDLTVQLAAIRDHALILHRPRRYAFVYGGLLVQATLRVAAVVDAL